MKMKTKQKSPDGTVSVPSRRNSRSRDVHLKFGSRSTATPDYAIGKQISDALDPTQAPGKVRSMADMSEEELAALAPPGGRR